MRLLTSPLLVGAAVASRLPAEVELSPVRNPSNVYITRDSWWDVPGGGGAFILSINVLNYRTENLDVKFTFNRTFAEPTAQSKSLYERHILADADLESEISARVPELFSLSSGDGNARAILVGYDGHRDDMGLRTKAQVAKACLESHGEDCDFGGWRLASKCLPTVKALHTYRMIRLDYTDVLEQCDQEDVRTDLEYVAKMFNISSLLVNAEETAAESEEEEEDEPLVERADELRWQSTPNDPDFIYQFYMKEQNVHSAMNGYARFKGNYKPRVCILSTGVDLDHTDLTPNLMRNEAEINGKSGQDDDGRGFVDDERGWLVGGGKPSGASALGTELSGIIGAKSNNGFAIAGIAGWNVDMVHCQRVHEVNHTLETWDEECFNYAESVNCQAVLYDEAKSTTQPQNPTPLMRTVHDRWLWLQRPVFTVTALTGSILGSDRFTYPACWNYPNHFTFAAVDGSKRLIYGSETGSLCVKGIARGAGMLTTGHRNYGAVPNGLTLKDDHRYAAAFMMGMYAQMLNVNPFISSYTLDKIWGHSTVATGSAVNTQYGGYVDLEKALYLLEDPWIYPWQTGHTWQDAEYVVPARDAPSYMFGGVVNSVTPELEGYLIMHIVDKKDNMRELGRIRVYLKQTHAGVRTLTVLEEDSGNECL